jgi:hypothetical protein
MIDVIELIRIDKLQYDEQLFMDIGITRILGSVISRRFACIMSDEFLLKHQYMMDWIVIARRRPLTWQFLHCLSKHNQRVCVGHINFMYSPMNVSEVLDILDEIHGSVLGCISVPIISSLCQRNLSSSDIDLILNFAEERSIIQVQILEYYQILSTQQRKCMKRIRIKIEEENTR